jgi:cytochrome P450
MVSSSVRLISSQYPKNEMTILPSSVVMRRLSLRPFTFSNGVTVPAGTLVAVPASAAHTDEEIYPNPNEFDGFRFWKLRDTDENKMTSRYQAVSTSSEHLTYGLGRHTWQAPLSAAYDP